MAVEQSAATTIDRPEMKIFEVRPPSPPAGQADNDARLD